MMFADRDYERVLVREDEEVEEQRPKVDVVHWYDNYYSIVRIRSKDRPKLLFDTVCTLTEMKYVVFHANVDGDQGPEAFQEYYIRHLDGSPLNLDAEKQRLIHCLEAVIEIRVSELELCTSNRVGLLSDVTRIFRENNLSVTRAEVTTKDGKALNTFYVQGASGYSVNAKTIESIRQVIGRTILKVNGILYLLC